MKKIIFIVLILICYLKSFSQTFKEYEKMGDLEFNNENYKQAILYFDSAINLIDTVKDDIYMYEIYFSRSCSKFNNQDTIGAISDISVAINLQPRLEKKYSIIISPAPYHKRGIYYSSLGIYNQAISDYSKALNIHYPKNVVKGIYYDLGNCFLALKRYDQAISNYNVELLKDSKNYKAYHQRGMAKVNLKDLLGAKKDFLKSIEINPNNYISYLMLGKLENFLDDKKSAITYFTKSINIDPKLVAAYSERADCKFALYDYRGAISDYSSVINLEPENKLAYVSRGNSKCILKDFDGGILDFNKAIEIDSYFASAYYARGFIEISINQKDIGCLDLSKAGELGYSKAYEVIKKYCNN